MELFDNHIEPDVDALLSVIRREKRPRRVHHIELFLDEEIKDVIGGRLGLGAIPDILDYERYLARDIKLHRLLGYDLFRIDPVPGGIFPLSSCRSGRVWKNRGSSPVFPMSDGSIFGLFPGKSKRIPLHLSSILKSPFDPLSLKKKPPMAGGSLDTGGVLYL